MANCLYSMKGPQYLIKIHGIVLLQATSSSVGGQVPWCVELIYSCQVFDLLPYVCLCVM